MSATNRSSTRLPPLWATRLEPSRLHQGTALVCGALSLLAVGCSGLPGWLMFFAAMLTLGVLLRLLRRLRHVGYLARLHDDQWLYVDQGRRYIGRLRRCRYRTSRLVILDLDDNCGRKGSVAVWQDCLPAADFSYLHCQLMTSTRHEQG